MDSLLDRTGAQLMLPGDWPAQNDMDLAVVEDDAGLPVMTGEQYFRDHPREYRIIVALRSAYGLSGRQVAQIVGCSRQTVAAIDRRELSSATADQYREAIANRLRVTLANVIERVDEAVADDERMQGASPRELASLMKEIAEKLQLFSGGATARVDKNVEHTADMDYLRSLQVAEAVDVTAVNTKQGE